LKRVILLSAYLVACVQSQTHEEACKIGGCHREVCSKEIELTHCNRSMTEDEFHCFATSKCELKDGACKWSQNCYDSQYGGYMIRETACNVNTTNSTPSDTICHIGSVCVQTASGLGECRCGGVQGEVCNATQICFRPDHSFLNFTCASQDANCPKIRCRYSTPVPDYRGCLGCGHIVCDLCEVNNCTGHAEVCVKTETKQSCRCMRMTGSECGNKTCMPDGTCQDPNLVIAPPTTTTTVSAPVNRHGLVWGGLVGCAFLAVFAHRRFSKRNERKKQQDIVYDVVNGHQDDQEEEDDEEEDLAM
jgi:hypothetical protein